MFPQQMVCMRKGISPLIGANENSTLRNIGFSNGSLQNCYATNRSRTPEVKPT